MSSAAEEPPMFLLQKASNASLSALWKRDELLKQVLTYFRYLSCSSMTERTNRCSVGVPVSLLGALLSAPRTRMEGVTEWNPRQKLARLRTSVLLLLLLLLLLGIRRIHHISDEFVTLGLDVLLEELADRVESLGDALEQAVHACQVVRLQKKKKKKESHSRMSKGRTLQPHTFSPSSNAEQPECSF